MCVFSHTVLSRKKDNSTSGLTLKNDWGNICCNLWGKTFGLSTCSFHGSNWKLSRTVVGIEVTPKVCVDQEEKEKKPPHIEPPHTHSHSPSADCKIEPAPCNLTYNSSIFIFPRGQIQPWPKQTQIPLNCTGTESSTARSPNTLTNMGETYFVQTGITNRYKLLHYFSNYIIIEFLYYLHVTKSSQ